MWRALLLLPLLRAAAASGEGACGPAEWACRAGGCVPGDAYCDGAPHCADGSDEPPRCTPCNRTYYGLAGRGYALELPEAPALPFLCHLTFTAGGGALGELVQLRFERFGVGRYLAAAREPCPDGLATLAELGRPYTGGAWCGAAAGAAQYYSETSTVTLSVRLWAGAPLQLRLGYRFLAAREAVVRFGPAAAPLERGAVSPGTYCTRSFEECHRLRCRLQSPNWPGLYPRNVSCYWSLRQRSVPTCKHAMISVRQDHAHNMQIKRSISMASLNKTGRAVAAWRDCTGDRDRLIVYDGATTDDPVLLEYCGGDWLPAVTSRGPDMLVAFHSAPRAAPPRAPAPLRGFQLDVAVLFADADSLQYAREPRRCEFHVKAPGGDAAAAGGDELQPRAGVLHAPRHTLPPGAQCSWTFHGRPGDVVWMYFASYSSYSLVEGRPEPEGTAGPPAPAPPTPAGGAGTSSASPWQRLRDMLRRPPASAAPPPPPPPGPAPGPERCGTELRVWDGGGAGEPGALLLGRYCDSAPALCARAALANSTRTVRACAPPDGYVSRGPLLALAARTRPGTAVHPLHFALHYEFVDARLAGAPLAGRAARPAACARVLTAPGALRSPRNVLWLGRGGARSLRCVWRLEPGAGAAAELTLGGAALGRGACSTRLDPRTLRPACVLPPPGPGAGSGAGAGAGSVVAGEPDDDDEEPDEEGAPLQVPHLRFYEVLAPGVRVPVACVCDNSSFGLTVRSAGALELELRARTLLPAEDARHLHFDAEWRRAPAPGCGAGAAAAPPGGPLRLLAPPCAAPVLLQARGNRSVFLRVWGEELPPAPAAAAAPAPASAAPDAGCPGPNRVLVHEARSGRLLAAVCPGPAGDEARTVQVFSPEWWGGAGGGALVVRGGGGRAAWLEVWRSADARDNASAWGAACAHACPELRACADAALWCDGVADCPRGADEAGRCGAARLLAALRGWHGGAGAAAAAAGAGAALLLLLVLLAVRRRMARQSAARDKAPPRRDTREPLLEREGS